MSYLNRYVATPAALNDGQATNFNLVDQYGRSISNQPTKTPLTAGGATPITVPLVGFANPKYIDPVSVDTAIGFDISDCQSIIFMMDSLGTATITAEQTLDPAGLAGWGSVQGKRYDSSNAGFSQNPATALQPMIFPALGVRMRFKVTALATADIVARIYKSYAALDLATGNPTITNSATIDGAFVSNPVCIGLRAANANPTAMSANADQVGALATMIGAQVMEPFSIPESSWLYAAAAGGIINTTDVVIKAAAAAGIRNYLTSLQLCNRNAVATEFVVKDNATVIWRTHLPANMVDSMDISFDKPLRGSAATVMNVACITTAAQVYCNAQGYIAP